MVSGLEGLAALYAPKQRQLKKPLPTDIAEVAAQPEGDINLDHPSAFESVLDTVSLGGYGVRNIMKGNLGGLARNVVDALTSIPRAILPGDQSYLELSGEEDKPHFSDVVNPGMEAGLAKTGLDLAGDIATDPLSYIGLGEFTGAARAAAAATKAVKAARAAGDAVKLAEAVKVAEAANTALKASRAAGETKTALGIGPLPFMAPKAELPGSAAALGYLGEKAGAGLDLAKAGIAKIPGGTEALEGVAKFGRSAKYALGMVNPGEKVAANLAGSDALGGATTRAASESGVAANLGTAKDIQEKAHLLIEDIVKGEDGVHAPIGVSPGESAVPGFGTRDDQIALIDQRLGKVAWDDATKGAVRETAIRESDRYRDLYRQSTKDAVLDLPAGAGDMAPLDYIPRQGDLKLAEEGATAEQRTAAMASMLKSRSLTDKAAFIEHLNKPGIELKSDLGEVGARYGQQIGSSVAKADLARRTIGEFKAGETALTDTGFKSLVDPASRARMNAHIDELEKIGKYDDAHALRTAFNGLPPAKGFWRAMATINKPFKAAATAGIIVPRVGFTVGNVMSNVVQFAENSEARGIAWNQAKSIAPVIIRAFQDGLKTLGVKSMSSPEMEELAAAAAASGGTRAGMMARIQNPMLKLAVEHGVLDGGFISAEQLASKAATRGDPKKLSNWLDWTKDVAKSSEQQMRWGGFVQLVKNGETPADAARIIDASLFDYKYSSVGNRNIRQIAPFAQYTMKATPQAAKFLAEKPAAAVGLNALYSQNDANKNPLPPWVQGNINLAVGKGETGNPQYLTQLRLPFETLSRLPNPSGDLGDIIADTQHDLVGQASPLIKTVIGVAGGNDPFTGQPFRSNDRAPAALEALGVAQHGAAARDYNLLASTGVIQPVASVVTTLSKLLDKRESIPVAALNTLTGLKVIDVDEQFALKQIIEDAIKRDPSIKSSANYYELNKTPEGQALLLKLREVQKSLKAKKKADALTGLAR